MMSKKIFKFFVFTFIVGQCCSEKLYSAHPQDLDTKVAFKVMVAMGGPAGALVCMYKASQNFIGINRFASFEAYVSNLLMRQNIRNDQEFRSDITNGFLWTFAAGVVGYFTYAICEN